MRISWKKFLVATLVIAVAVLLNGAHFSWKGFQPLNVPKAYAGNITTAGWNLSSDTLSATGVTYTHTFTTATAMTGGGTITIELRTPPGPSVPLPDFSASTTGAGSTTGLSGLTPSIYWSGSAVSLTLTTSTTIPAGSVTVAFTNVTNPSQGAVLQTNTSTASTNGTALDGTKFSATPNGTLVIGPVVLSGQITDSSTGNPVAGVPLQIHTMNGNGAFQQTYTDSHGNYQFVGVPAGADYVLEMRIDQLDPNNTNTATVSQYVAFNPVNVTITSSPQTLNKTITKSSKLITGTVYYAGTTTPVVGAQVNANTMGDGGFANTTTDNTGNFTLRLASSGNVFVGIMPPFQQPPPPNNQQQPSPTPTPTPASTDFAAVSRQTAFVKDAATPETIALGVIEVQKATATVTGKLLNPDGSGAMGGAGLMNASDHSMQPLFIQQDGSFTAKLIPGTYTLSSFDPTGAYSMPSNTTFTIKEGSNQLPSITKIANTGVVTVKAERTDNGQGIPNVQAMVFSKSGQDQPPYFATTDSNGVAHVKVPAGFQGMAGVMPGGNFGGGPQGGGSGGPQAMLPYVMALLGVDKVMAQTNPTPPPGGSSDINQLVPVTGMQEVSAGDSIVAKFAKANTQVNIRTVDSNGNLVTQGAFVDAALQSGTFPVHFGGPTAGGIGQIYVVSGTVKFQVMTPPDSPYGGVAKTVDITTNGQSVDLVLAQKTVTVTGSVLNASDNNAVIKDPSLNIQVGAFGDGAFSVGKYDPATGTYSVKILPGTPMRVGVAAGDPSQPTKGGFIPNINPKPVSGTDGQTVSLDVSLAKVDATISGKVTDNTGAPVEGLSVVADPGLAALVSAAGVDVGPGHGPDKGPQFSFNDVTDANGNFSIPVTAGTYNLLVNDHSSNLYMSSVVQATVTSGQTVSGKNIQLTKADATIKVSAVDSTGKALTGAYVHIFDDLGNISLNLPVDGSGAATADVPAGTYTFQAGKDDINSGAAQKSPFAKVLAEANKTVSVTAQTSTETGALAAPITTSVSTSSSTVVPIMNGSVTTASISIPSGALSSSSGQNGNNSGNPILAMTPIKAELPQTKADTAFTGVQITASDASGNSITSLSGSVTGQVKVNPSDLPAGLDPSNLTVKSYNSTTGQWEAVQASSVDTTKDSNGDYTVSFQTNHFTTFAVVASTDTTAPDAPTNISATDKGTGGTINLSWTNPTSSNLAGIDIYRSTTAGSLGTKVYSSISGTSKDDTGLTNGTAYYYTVRAVGTNGIESTNTTQVSATPTLAGSTPKTGDLGWWQSLKQRVEADLLSLVP